jgi:hypothetical protein
MKKLVKVIAEEVIDSVQDAAQGPAVEAPPTDPEQSKRYLARGVEEVSKLTEDLNADLGDILEDGKKKIASISIDEAGNAIIKLQKEVKVTDENRVNDVLEKAKTYNIPEKFSSNVSWQFNPPQGLSTVVSVTVRIRVPAEVLKSLFGEDPTAEWKKATAYVEKLGKEYLNIL